MLPIQLKLKRRTHKEIAYAQDLIVETLYEFFPKAVMHGGTAIWRCYEGNRFSEDVDVYINKDKEKIRFQINKKRIKENSLYSTLKFNASTVRFEALFKTIRSPFLKEYETSEGILINIFTLTSENLIEEKINTYLKRKKIRDLYDIFFLLRHAEKSAKLKEKLKVFVEKFSNQEDEQNLKTIIIIGVIPTVKNMMEHIERWAR